MTGRERMKLTDAAIARLRPREREYTVWDSRVAGLGVRVRPSGGKSYVLLLDMGGGSKRVSLGPVAVKGVEEVRRECHARRANPEPEGKVVQARPVPLFRDFIAGAWKEVHFDGYKPSTKRSIRYQLAVQLLPAFGAKPLDRIEEAGIRRWFDRYSRTAPGNANHALARLRQILNFAIACGHIESNPAEGIEFNRRPKLTRFLSREELGRLHSVLDEHARKGGRQQVDIVRLLLLTGCRRGEIVTLRRSEVHDDMLSLGDSKTGPRKVPLNSQARAILDRQPRTGSPFVFPSPRDASRPRCPDLTFWYRVRARSRHRGRAPSRPPAYPCEPRDDERSAVAGRLPSARALQCADDAALRPSRGPGYRSRGRARRCRDGTGHVVERGTFESRLTVARHRALPLQHPTGPIAYG